MFRVALPIPEFLESVLTATYEHHYLGLVFVLARSADGPELHNELYDNWSSINDLTNEHVLLVVAGKGGAGVAEINEPVEFSAPGISIESSPSQEWRRAFMAGIPNARYGGQRLTPMETREVFSAAITNATSQAARYLGISEQHIPALVVISTRERRGVAISLADRPTTFSIYGFLKNLLTDFVPTVKNLWSIQRNYESAWHELKSLTANLAAVDRNMRNHVLNWTNQLSALNHWLGAAETNELQNATQQLSAQLQSTERDPQQLRDLGTQYLEAVKHVHGESSLCFKRLNMKLPAAIERALFLSTPTVLQEDRATRKAKTQLAQQQQRINDRYTQLNEMRAVASAQLLELTTRNYYGQFDRVELDTLDRNSTRLPIAVYSFRPPESRQFEYDIAISYAGEDGATARAIATSLRSVGISVFYAGFEQSYRFGYRTPDMWGVNLYDYLLDVFMRRARFSLLLLSSNYRKKVWTQFERQAAQAAALFGREDKVLPVKLDESEHPEILPTIGFLSYQQVGLDGLVIAVQQKLAMDHNMG